VLPGRLFADALAALQPRLRPHFAAALCSRIAARSAALSTRGTGLLRVARASPENRARYCTASAIGFAATPARRR
jgi:hypothetical protein